MVLNVSLIPRFGIEGAAVATITSFMVITALSIYSIVKLTGININVKWYASVFAITISAMALFSVFSEWINQYVIGFSILIFYMAVFFIFFLTKDDKAIFEELIRSIVSKYLK